MKKIVIIIIILAVLSGSFYLGEHLILSLNNKHTVTSFNESINPSRSVNAEGHNNSSNQTTFDNQGSRTSSAQNNSSSNNLSQSLGITPNQIPKGYGNFSDLIHPANQEQLNSMPNGPMFLLLTIPINGQNFNLQIDVTNVKYDGSLLVLTGHYLNKPFEQFTYYISNTSDKAIDEPHKNPQYTMYEFYNGINTGIFKLNFQGAAVYGGLSGTFEHVGSNKIYQCEGPFINNNANTDNLGVFPYYNGSINGTNVTIATTNNQNVFKEKYANDSNIFTLNQISMPSQFKSENYKYALEEQFNGNVTGVYLLNINPDTKNLTGIFMHMNNGEFLINNATSVTFVQSALAKVS